MTKMNSKRNPPRSKMSATEKLQSNYLTCSLCSEPFHQPKSLPCLHNFCKKCLSDYLEEMMKGGRHSTFDCPECRKKIYVPDPSKAVIRWASQFPTNFTLIGMIEAITDEEGEEKDVGEHVKAARARRGETGSSKDKKKSEADDLNTRLENLKTTIQSEENELDTQLAEIIRDHQVQKKHLQNSFDKVLDLIQGRKMQLVEELDTNFEDEKDRVEQTKQSYKNSMKSVTMCADLLTTIETKQLKKDVKKDMFGAIEDQVEEIEDRPTKVIARHVKFSQTLEAGRSVLNLVDALGSVTITTTGQVDRDDSLDEGGEEERPTSILTKPKILTAISARLDANTVQQVHGVTVMPSGTVIMTAREGNLVFAAKNFGSEYKIYAHLQLDSKPLAITTYSAFYVAIVGQSCMYFVGVTDAVLVMKKKVQTGKDYVGIAAYGESSLVLCSQSPPCIDFVGLNGYISESIEKDHTTGSVLFKSPQFLTVSKDGTIYVSDHNKQSRLLSLNNAGKVRFVYPPDEGEDFRSVQGVASDSNGHVYVVDREAKEIVLITPAGERVKVLLSADDGLTDPCAIAIDDKDNLYVTNDFKEILVFRIM